MPNSFKALLQKSIRFAIVMAPWVIASYVFYWLESSGTWTSDTPHRGKISVFILAGGMALSFLINSYLEKRSQ